MRHNAQMPRQPVMQIFLCFLSLLLAAALLSAPARAVIGGSGPVANLPGRPFSGVVAVLSGNGAYSGALVAPEWVLTAAHVVAGRSPAQVRIRFNLAGGPVIVPAAAIEVYPGFHGARPGPDGVWYGDLALVRLARPAPAAARYYRFYRGPALHATITFVGYGAWGDGTQGQEGGGNAAIARMGRNRIDLVLPSVADGKVYVYDFDGPDGLGNRFGNPADPANQAILGEGVFGGGDSGAPVFVARKGGWRILGIAVFVAPPQAGAPLRFGAIGGGTIVASYLPWIQRVMAGR